MNGIGDLQVQVNVLFFAVFLLVIFTAITLQLAFRTARQWRRTIEQLTNKIALLEEKVASMEGK
jgi:Flp pilus assembly protein TadB